MYIYIYSHTHHIHTGDTHRWDIHNSHTHWHTHIHTPHTQVRHTQARHTHKWDIHTHILPNIDDGARSIEETFNLIREAKNAGFKIGDIITFRKLPDLKEKLDMLVTDVQVYNDFREAVTPYFEEDFSDRYEDIDSLVESFYSKGYYNKDEVEKYGTVVFTLEKID